CVATAVAVAAEQATEREKRLAALRDEWQVMISDARQREGKVRATRRDSALRTILDSLPGTPVLTTAPECPAGSPGSSAVPSPGGSLSPCPPAGGRRRS